MGVVRHTDIASFAEAAAPMIRRSQSTATIIGSWVDWLAKDPPTFDERVYLATYSESGAIGVACRRRNYAVRIEDSAIDAAVAFARDLATDWPQLQGVIGTLAPCEAFARTWLALVGRKQELRFRLRSHLLTGVNAVDTPSGAMRHAESADTPWIIAALAAFIVEARLPDDPTRAVELATKNVERDEIRVWEDGRPVAFARWTPAGAEAARIGPVWTVASARRRGYATALVAALSRELLDAGRRRIVLDSDLANTTSNGVYARVGFRPLHDFYHYDFVEP